MSQKLPAAFSFVLLFAFAVMLLPYGKEPDPPPLKNPDLVRSESMSRAGDLMKVREAPFSGARMTRSWRVLLLRAREEGWRGSLNGPISGVRTRAEQRYLYKAFLAGWGAPAFRPEGPSRHLEENVWKGEWAQAVDVSRPEELLLVAKKMGVPLYQPYSSEPWHIEARSPFAVPSAGNLPPLSERREPGSVLWVLLALAALFAVFSRERAARVWLLLFSSLGAALLFISYPVGAVFFLLGLLLLAPWLFLQQKLLFPVPKRFSFYVRGR